MTTPFGPRAPLLMALFGVLAFIAYAVLATFGDSPRGDDGGGHALSEGATGEAALLALLKAGGADVRVARTAAAGQSAGLLVLTPPPEADVAAVTDLIEARGRQLVLVVLPKWRTAPQQDRRGWVWRGPLVDADAALRPLSRTLGADFRGVRLATDTAPNGRLSGPDYSVIPPDRLRSLSGPALEPVVTAPDGRVVLGYWRPNLYVLADPDLIANHGLAQRRDALAAVRLITQLAEGRPIIFDVTLNGLGAGGRSLGRLALTPPFLGVTLCLILAAALAAWAALPRFGRPLPAAMPTPQGSLTLVDNAAGLITAAGREGAAAARYATLALARAATRARLPAGLSPAEQAERLGHDYHEHAARAAAARRPAEALTAAQALHEWEEGMSHER